MRSSQSAVLNVTTAIYFAILKHCDAIIIAITIILQSPSTKAEARWSHKPRNNIIYNRKVWIGGNFVYAPISLSNGGPDPDYVPQFMVGLRSDPNRRSQCLCFGPIAQCFIRTRFIHRADFILAHRIRFANRNRNFLVGRLLIDKPGPDPIYVAELKGVIASGLQSQSQFLVGHLFC